jgi:hypothetical protein
VDSEVEVMKTLCGKLAAAMPRVTPPPKTEGAKCVLSMLDIPDAVAGLFDIGMMKEILTKASDIMKRASLVDWMMKVQGALHHHHDQVIIDRDMSTLAGVWLDMGADVAKLIAGVFLSSRNGPAAAIIILSCFSQFHRAILVAVVILRLRPRPRPADSLPDVPAQPSTSPLDPNPWFLDLVSSPVGLLGAPSRGS